MQKIIQAKITRLGQKGQGIALLEKETKVEAIRTLPGDLVSLEVGRQRRGVAKGRLLEILEPSEHRVAPRCSHASHCGGCAWQALSYRAQLAEKQRRVETLFPDHAVLPIIAAEEIFYYRNKMEFTFSQNKDGSRFLGLMMADGKGKVLNLEECHLAGAWMIQVLGQVRGWWSATELRAYHPHRNIGTLRYLTLREGKRSGEKMAILNVSGDPEWAIKKEDLDGICQIFKDLGISFFLRIHQAKKGSPTQFFEMHLSGAPWIHETLHLDSGPLTFKISPTSFFQPNTFQAEKLYQAAINLLKLEKIDLLFDLYCGAGTISLAASRVANKVIGIEIAAEAVLDAEENKALNHIQNVHFLQGGVGTVLNQLHEQPDAVILDPPRVGLDPAALSHLKRLSPKIILYISCNPVSQAKNILELTSFGYEVQTIQPVDQFPHTYHIENIVLLKLNEPSRIISR